MRKIILLTIGLLYFFHVPVAFSQAQPAAASDEASIPAELKGWVPWVKNRHSEWNCARVPRVGETSIEDARQCVWIGFSRFVISEKKTEFTIQGELLDDDIMPLPSGSLVRPNNVTVVRDGSKIESYSLIENGSEIGISLRKGGYIISGELLYDALPNQIPVPSEYGIVDIQLVLEQGEGRQKATAYRDRDSIRISREVDQLVARDSAEGRIWRAVSDNNPLSITTKIELQISGKPRTINLGSILPKDAVLIRSESSTQISFTDANQLIAQVFQGQHEITLESVLSQPVAEIVLPKTAEDILPEEEIWTWEGNQEMRSVEVENVRTLNLNQVDLPSGWSATSVYAVARGATVVLKELRRGQETLQRNEISLRRSLWPVLDGSGLTVEDTFSGTMNSGFRLNARPDLNLGSAAVNGVPVPITVDPKNKTSGVELRSQAISLKTNSQVSSEGMFGLSISAGGWESLLENIQYNIAIPPSWKLLHISNVTSQYGSWSSFWSIFDIFIVLILTVFSYKIFGRTIAILFVVLVLIGKSEFMLPATFYGWTLFFAACSLLLSAKSYRLLRVCCGAGLGFSLAALIVQGLIFAKLQLVQAIHPQLQSGTRYRTITQEIFSIVSDSPFVWPFLLYSGLILLAGLVWVWRGKYIIQKFGRLIALGIGFFFVSSLLAGVMTFLTDRRPYNNYANYQAADDNFGGSALEESSQELAGVMRSAPSSVKRKVLALAPQQAAISSRELNSGPSLPQWKWRWASATVAGPVNPDHTITFYFIPDSLERILCLIRLCVTLLLLYTVITKILGSFMEMLKALIPPPVVTTTTTTAALLVLSILMFSHQNAYADFPNQELLNELEEQIAEKQCSDTNCASIDSITLSLEADSFTMELHVRSRGVSSVSIPGPISELIPNHLTIDGRESTTSRLHQKYLQVKIPDGVHEIHVYGAIDSTSSIAVSIPEKPLHFSVHSSVWKTEAPISVSNIPNEIRFHREEDNASSSKAGENKKGVVPTRDVFRVTREFTIDERISIEGTVERLGTANASTRVVIPLIAGENISSSNLATEGSSFVVTFAAGQTSAGFSSSIANPSELKLTAAKENTLFEEWTVHCKDYVQCESEGLAPTKSIINGQNALSFLPFKGDSLTVRSQLLESVKGDRVTIDSIQHGNTWGETALKGKVELAVRATKQSSLVFSFNDGSLTIDSATIDGAPDSRKFTPENFSLLVEPGEHRVTIDYSKPFTPKFTESVPQLKVNYRAGNITTTVQPHPSRWILWLGGGSWGPAVVFWSKLFVILIILIALKITVRLLISWPAVLVLSVAISFLPTITQPVPVLWIIYLSSAAVREQMKKYLGERVIQAIVSTVAVLSVVLFYFVVRVGLLREPPSLITGNGSSSYMLRWFIDFAQFGESALLPTPWVLSLPLSYWRTITLVLSVALVFLALKWIRETVAYLKEGDGE